MFFCYLLCFSSRIRHTRCALGTGVQTCALPISATEKLMVRQVASDWGKEVDPTLSIEQLDTPAAKPQLSAAEMSARLAELPNMIANASSFFVDHVEGLRRDGFIKKFRRSEERRVGKGCVSTVRSRWSPYH